MPTSTLPTVTPLTDDQIAKLQTCVDIYNQEIAEYTEPARQIDAGKFALMVDLIKQGNAEQCATDLITFHQTNTFRQATNELLQSPDLQLIQTVRLITILTASTFQTQGYNDGFNFFGYHSLIHYRDTHQPAFTLQQLAEVLQALGINDSFIYEAILDPLLGWESTYSRDYYKFEPAAVWSYFAERLSLLEDAYEHRLLFENIRRSGFDLSAQRRTVMVILSYAPELPEMFVDRVWQAALGSTKGERAIAQSILDRLPDTFDKVVSALNNRDKDSRLAATQWLARLNQPQVLPDLKKALDKEKSEDVIDALYFAMERLGMPIDQLLDRNGMIKAAKKESDKPLPEELNWLLEPLLPKVHWAENNELVEPFIIKYLILQCYKKKNPVPTPRLRRFVTAFNQRDREQLGLFILQGWITVDTRVNTLEEAKALAQRDLKNSFPNMNSQEAQEWLLKFIDVYIQHCNSSAIKEKGVMAMVAACNSAAVVPMVDKYLKEWYGMRVAQCRALLQMLAWIDDPMAIQLLLSVAKRFRTKSIQTEAELQVSLLTERKNWTRDELSDRTIPFAHLDENGQLILDYGKRKFIGALDRDLNLVLKDESGKAIKSLPAPHKDEDEGLAKFAKKQFAEAKKQLKLVLDLQRERLYEAMCTQRNWRFSDWQIFLNRHPIIGFYCRRLIWAVVTDDAVTKTFRPLADGTLSDNKDDEISVNDNETIRLAHATNLTREDISEWQRHLNDYDVVPLFDQLNRETYQLLDEQRRETSLTEFAGYLITAYRLRAKATKLGYLRGQNIDSGWFVEYKKSYPGLALEVVIEFTGNQMPEEDRRVALVSLYFRTANTSNNYSYGMSEVRRRLDEIPAVLLSESWNDIREIAREGEGYREDWRELFSYR